MFRPLNFILVAGIALTASARIVHADAPTRADSVRVDYSDLDLVRHADARVMLNRLERAAFRACGGDSRSQPAYYLMPLLINQVVRKCREDAVAKAVAAVDARELWLAFETGRGTRDVGPQDARS